MHYLVDEQRKLGLILGIDGGGKSCCSKSSPASAPQRRAGCPTGLLGVDTHELLWCVAADLGANPERTATEFQLWRMITDCLAANRMHGTPTVMLLDDVDEADRW